MANVTTIGSALVDIFIQSPQFFVDQEGSLNAKVSGGKLAVDSFALKTGGGASNTAVGFARLGHQARIVAEVGKDELAQLVIHDLVREKVYVNSVIQEHKEETGGSVILIDSDSGDRTALTHRGASSMLDPHDLPTDLDRSDLIHISSLSGQLATLQQLFALQFSGKRSWNPGVEDIQLVVSGQLSLTNKLDFLFVNTQEWTMFEPARGELLSHCQTIVITDGVAGGEVYQYGQLALHYQAEAVKAVDSTGAGDAFAVGFLSAQFNGASLTDSVELAKQNAASVVQFIGAKQGLLRSA